MARMLPPTIHSAVTSAGERRIFKQIQKAQGTEDWRCLHSLGLAKHERKRRAEIDFLLVCPLGVFVLEVKGGRVQRTDGVWIHTNRYGESTRKSEGPFDQASSAMFALERELAHSLNGIRASELLFGYGVLFPDVEYSSVGCDESPALVYDARDTRRPFREYVTQLAEYTRTSQPRRRRGLRPEEIEAICDHLRGDFDFQPVPDLELEDARRHLGELTAEQRTVLDAADDAPRLLVDGPAGSGKTLLAMEAARREARLGRRVLFLCFNRLLAARVRTALRVESYAGKIEVETLASHCRRLVDGSSLSEQFGAEAKNVDDDELYKSLLPGYAAMAAMERAAPAYDCLVIDEAQDILSDGLADLLSEELLDATDHGRWRIFLDENNQAAIFGALDSLELDRFARVATKRVNLSLNCRNTKEIALQTHIVSQPRNRATALVSGPAVDFRKYRTDAQFLAELEKLLDELRGQGVAGGRVSVLFVKRPSDNSRRELSRVGLRELQERDVGDLGRTSLADMTWSTVSAFKGLENDVVILAGVRDVEKDWWRGVTYVGMSRARSLLYVIVHSSCDRVLQRRLREEMKRLSSEEMIT